jgi:hypothetical protein
LFNCRWILEITLPYRQHTPAQSEQGFYVSRITLPILFDLWFPETSPSGWQGPGTAVVTVPETAIYEDDRPTTREHKIGFARQILSIKPKPIATCMQGPP